MEQTINDELLTRYLANEATTSEQAFVESWMAGNDANCQYLDTLRLAWQLAAARPLLDMNMSEKWTQFRQAREETAGRVEQTGRVEKIESEEETGKEKQTGRVEKTGSEEQTGKEEQAGREEQWHKEDQSGYEKHLTPKEHSINKKGSIKRSIAILAAAASICLLIMAGWQYLYTKQDTGIAETKQMNDLPQDSLHHQVNNSGKEMKLTMTDGTDIHLGNQSALTWREPFGYSRTISISGKALFHVSPKGPHPFTVISGDISTTVLGTSFEVNTFQDISVRLYSGKVMITSSNTRRMKNKVYLSPGQEFIYGKQIFVRSFLQQLSSFTKDNHPAEDPYIASGEESNWYMFNNQSLAEVLNQLEAIYKVKIIYNKNDIKDIYFTARYERTASLAIILKRIAKLNDLKITGNDSVMIIKK
jgi:ferric-dicitrate binding protein FerR (iron transport regulator)